jgi:hypothetical protein
MDPGLRSPLIDFFRRGEVARDVRLLAAQGAMAPRATEQLALLVLLSDDPDPDVAGAARATIAALPVGPLSAFLGRADTPKEMREFFALRGIEPDPAAAAALPPAEAEEPIVDTLSDLPADPGAAASETDSAETDSKLLSSLPVMERVKLAMKGTREQRAVLIRDANKLVAAAVLSSPKVNESEIEQFTKMGNVSEDVLRMIGHNRGWLKNYGVVLGLCKHPKTPPAVSMQLVHRLNEKDVRMLTMDRNVQEGVRALARKMASKGKI